MKKAEWIKILESEVDKQFNSEDVNGFEDSAPSIKLGILSDMYDNEPMDIELSKELAYDELANTYSTLASWN